MSTGQGWLAIDAGTGFKVVEHRHELEDRAVDHAPDGGLNRFQRAFAPANIQDRPVQEGIDTGFDFLSTNLLAQGADREDLGGANVNQAPKASAPPVWLVVLAKAWVPLERIFGLNSVIPPTR